MAQPARRTSCPAKNSLSRWSRRNPAPAWFRPFPLAVAKCRSMAAAAPAPAERDASATIQHGISRLVSPADRCRPAPPPAVPAPPQQPRRRQRRLRRSRKRFTPSIHADQPGATDGACGSAAPARAQSRATPAAPRPMHPRPARRRNAPLSIIPGAEATPRAHARRIATAPTFATAPMATVAWQRRPAARPAARRRRRGLCRSGHIAAHRGRSAGELQRAAGQVPQSAQRPRGHHSPRRSRGQGRLLPCSGRPLCLGGRGGRCRAAG